MTVVVPYGDEPDDGLVQITFTLPLPHTSHTDACAIGLVRSWGINSVQIVHSRPLGDGFTLYILYGRATSGIDPDTVPTPRAVGGAWRFSEINRTIVDIMGRQLIVVAAASGSDAHTVGLDSILSMKGRSGDHGLEKYPALRIINLGSQVPAERLADAAASEAADVVLVSQVVTQRGIHEKHFSDVHDALVSRGLRERVLLVGGGPGVGMADAERLGYDGMFGRGTKPAQVAAFLADEVRSRRTYQEDGNSPAGCRTGAGSPPAASILRAASE